MQDERHVIYMNPRYQRGLAAFKKRCTDNTSIMQFLAESFERDAHGIRTSLQTNSAVNAADIGCGDGIITTYVANLLMKTVNGEVELDIIEPLECYILKTREKMEKHVVDGLKTTYIKQRAEDFFTPSISKKYDIVFSSHSLHLVSLNTISHIASAIKSGGYFIVVIGAKNSIMSILKDLFISKSAITGEDILKFMQENNIKRHYDTEMISQPSLLDLRNINFTERKKELEEGAKNLISLMVQKNIDEVDQDGYALARQLILERLHDGQLRLDNDCFIFRNIDKY